MGFVAIPHCIQDMATKQTGPQSWVDLANGTIDRQTSNMMFDIPMNGAPNSLKQGDNCPGISAHD